MKTNEMKLKNHLGKINKSELNKDTNLNKEEKARKSKRYKKPLKEQLEEKLIKKAKWIPKVMLLNENRLTK